MCLTLSQDICLHHEKRHGPACWRMGAHLDQSESAQLSQLRPQPGEDALRRSAKQTLSQPQPQERTLLRPEQPPG